MTSLAGVDAADGLEAGAKPARTATGRGFGELRSGNLGVRIATEPAEIDAVQALRYRVFYEEMGARPDPAAHLSRRDRDAFDPVADHLLVVDHEIGDGPEGVVGTYRLIQRDAAARVGRFYSADEYDLGPILRFPAACWNWAARASPAGTGGGR